MSLCLVLVGLLGGEVVLSQSGGGPIDFLGKEKAASTAKFIASLRAPTGGYATQKGSSPSLRATFQARKALATLGVAPVNPAADQQFVRKCVEEETLLFVDRPGDKPSTLLSAAGIMCAVAVGLGEAPDFQPVIKANARNLELSAKVFEEIRLGAAAFEAIRTQPGVRREWIHQLRKTQNPEGGYGPSNSRLRDTGGVLAALLRLGEKIDDKEKQVYMEYLLEGQGKAGGFGMTQEAKPDLDSSYRIGRALWMMGATPEVKRMHSFLKACQTDSGGFSVQPGEEGTLADTYRAVMIASWLTGKRGS